MIVFMCTYCIKQKILRTIWSRGRMTQNCVQALDQFILDRLVEDQTRRAGGPKRVRTDWTEKLSTLLKCRPKASFERLEAIGDGSYSKVYHVSDKGTTYNFVLY